MLYYREAGEGPLAVFLHGFPLDHSMWLDQLAGLGHVRRCVAVDLRGYGRSDPIVESSLTMEVFADDVAALIEALGANQADVIGLSMGGYVALALYELRPELVRSLALMDTKASADTPDARAGRDGAVAQLLDKGRTVFADSMLPKLLASQPAPGIQARVRSMIEGTRYETIVASQEGMKERPDRTHLLEQIVAPTLVVGGEEDRITPPDTIRELASQITGARTAVIPGAGHLPPLERPDPVNSALIEIFEGRKVVWWRD